MDWNSPSPNHRKRRKIKIPQGLAGSNHHFYFGDNIGAQFKYLRRARTKHSCRARTKKHLQLLLLPLPLSIILPHVMTTQQMMIPACHGNANTEDIEINKALATNWFAWNHTRLTVFFEKSDVSAEPPVCASCLIKEKQAQK